MNWPFHTPQPTVSIVMPVTMHGDRISATIDAWARQHYPHDKLELILVSAGRQREADALVAERLSNIDTPRGGIVTIKTDCPIAQLAYGARYAHGQWLIFTEPSSCPQPDCTSQLVGTLMERGQVGGCVQVVCGTGQGRFAALNARISQVEVALRAQPDDWRKFCRQGFALRRDVYRSIGGFEVEYGRLGELIIAARLAAEGHEIGHVPSAVVEQWCAPNWRQRLEEHWEYQQELARYLREGSVRLRPYLAPLAHERGEAPRKLAHCVANFWLARVRLALGSITAERDYHNFLAAARCLSDWAAVVHSLPEIALHVPEGEGTAPEILPGPIVEQHRKAA